MNSEKDCVRCPYEYFKEQWHNDCKICEETYFKYQETNLGE